MIRIYFFKKAKWLCFAFFIPTFLLGQTPIFEITGHGLKKPSYLTGTLHLGCDKAALIPPNSEKILQSCDALVLEMNLNNTSEQLKISFKSLVPKDRALNVLMGDRYQTFHDSLLLQYQVNSNSFTRFHPMVTLSILMSKFIPCEHPKGSEMIFLDIVDSLNKKIIGLETAAEQSDILFSIPDSLAIQQLWDIGMNRSKAENEWKQLNQKFQQGNIDSIFQYVSASEEMAYDLNKLLINRNKNWVEKLPVMMKKQSLFIAVGAGHLGGPNGVVALLRQSGYTVVEKQ